MAKKSWFQYSTEKAGLPWVAIDGLTPVLRTKKMPSIPAQSRGRPSEVASGDLKPDGLVNYGEFDATVQASSYLHAVYIEVRCFPPGTHTLRIECLGQEGSGGAQGSGSKTDVPISHFGFRK